MTDGNMNEKAALGASQASNNSENGQTTKLGRRSERSGTVLSGGSVVHFDTRRSRASDTSMSNGTDRPTSSSRTAVGRSNEAELLRRVNHVRSVPAWITSEEEEQEADLTSSDRRPVAPSRALISQHHYDGARTEERVSQDGWVEEVTIPALPATKGIVPALWGAKKTPGRKWDYLRTKEPNVTTSRDPQEKYWGDFMRSTATPHPDNEESMLVDYSVLENQTPGYAKPWRGDIVHGDVEKGDGLYHRPKRRRVWYQKIQHVLLVHPFVPALFRLVVFITSIVALGISGSIFNRTKESGTPQNPSTIMAIGVDVVAIPYIIFISKDEYFAQPLGLRSMKAKLSLILLDLLFIIFESANLALAFAALIAEDGTCEPGSSRSSLICSRVYALCAIVFIALVAWVTTFTVSLFRVAEKVGLDEHERRRHSV